MFVILLKFSDRRDRAGAFMDGHNAWLKAGFEDGVFLLAGGIQPSQGGAILAQGTTRSDLEKRVEADPFVAEKIVKPEIIEITPGKADPRLNFLIG